VAVYDPDLGRAVPLPPLEEWAALSTAPGATAPPLALRRSMVRRLVVADAVALLAAGIVAPVIVSAVSSNPASSTGRLGSVYAFDVVMVPVILGIFALYGLYRTAPRRIAPSVFSDLKGLVHALMVSGFVVSIVSYGARRLDGQTDLSVGKVAALCATSLLFVLVARGVSPSLRGRREATAVPMIVVGTGAMARTVAGHLRSHANVNFVGFVDDNPVDGQDSVLGGLDDLPELCRTLDIGRVVVCFSRTHPERTIAMLKSLAGQVAVSIVPRYYELVTIRSHVEDVYGLPIIDIAPPSLSSGARFAKRLFDVVAASLVLVVMSPVLLAVALAIRLTSPGPVLFRQVRAGRLGQPFEVLKFRTMVVGAEDGRADLREHNEVDGPLFKMRDDPRVTRVGRWLRRTSLDELPQLLNVWKGDMSLVGPRPFVVDEAQAIEGWARKRFEARPGMTGLWQVSGRNELSYLELCRLDYLYVASWSFWWDVKILWQTPATIVRGRGAS
jgi:exopolysaccharide biosynthesis polyprenyl glycosylphosphotransferase